VSDEASSSAEYDVSAANTRLAKFQRQRRRMGWSAILVADFGALVVAYEALLDLRNGPPTEYQWSLLVSMLAAAALITPLGLRLIRKCAPGGKSIRLGTGAFEIYYLDGTNDRVSYLDPNLRFELYDFSAHPELAARSSLHSVVVNRRETELPEAAYRLIYERSRSLGLIRRSVRVHSVFVPDSIQPIVHTIRGRSAR
jgi:hypothetical protein